MAELPEGMSEEAAGSQGQGAEDSTFGFSSSAVVPETEAEPEAEADVVGDGFSAGPEGDIDSDYMQNASDTDSTGRWQKGVTQFRNVKVPYLKDSLTEVYKCTLCSYKSTNRGLLRSHYASHSNARPYGCEFCEYRAKRSSDLRKHKILKHGKSSVKPRGFQTYDKNGAPNYEYDFGQGKGPSEQNYPNFDLPPKDMLRAVFPEPELQDMFIDCDSDDVKERLVCVKPEAPDKENDDFDFQNLLQSVDVGNAGTKSQLNSAGDDDDSSLLSGASNDAGSAAPRTPPSVHTANISGRSLYNNSLSRMMSPASHYSDHQRMPQCSAEDSPNSLISQPNSIGVKTKQSFLCAHCNIIFFDGAIYSMHMGLHDPAHPWQCNLCGERLHDVYGFTSHFINGHNRRVHDD